MVAAFILPLDSCSDRFCAIKLHDSCGLSILMICVYMPGVNTVDAANTYFNTLGELEGFMDSHEFDLCFVILMLILIGMVV